MLKSPPSENHLSRIYYELSQLGAASSGEKKPWPYRFQDPESIFALAAEMSRYDPRLLGICVEFLLKYWRKLNLPQLRTLYPKMKTPQSLAVISEFVKKASQDPESVYAMDYLQRGLKPVKNQLYFKNIYSPAGRWSNRAVEESLAEYKRWGFLAREAPTIDVYAKKTIGHLSQTSRLNILGRVFAENKEIKISDYLKALGKNISRQQALQDLKRKARLIRGTSGRGSRWVLKK